MEFDIIYDTDIDNFIELVNERLADGWTRDEMMNIVADGSDKTYFQAMTRIIEA